MTEGELAEESMQRLRKQAKAKTPGIRYRPARNLSELEVLKPLAPRPIPIPRFGPIEMVTDDEEITTCLHRALVEVYTLRQAGKPLSEAWAVDPISDQTHTVQIRLNDDGEVNLVYSADMTSKKVLDSLVASVEDVEDVEVEDELVAEEEEDEMVTRAQSEMKSTEASLSEPASTDKPGEIVAVADQTSEETPATPKTYRDVINSWDTTWLLTPLKDMEIKFAVGFIGLLGFRNSQS